MREDNNDLRNYFGVGIAILLVMTGLWIVFGWVNEQERVYPFALKIIGLAVVLFFGVFIVIRIMNGLKK